MKKIVILLAGLAAGLFMSSPAFSSTTCSPFTVDQHITGLSPNVKTVGGNSINVRNAKQGETIAHLIVHATSPGCTDTLKSISSIEVVFDFRTNLNLPLQVSMPIDANNTDSWMLIDYQTPGLTRVDATGPLEGSIDIPIVYNGGVNGNSVVIPLDAFNNESNYGSYIYASGSQGSADSHAFRLNVTHHVPLTLFESSPLCEAFVDDVDFGDIDKNKIINASVTSRKAVLHIQCDKTSALTAMYFSFSGAQGEETVLPGVIKSSNNTIGFRVNWGDNVIAPKGGELKFHEDVDLPQSALNITTNSSSLLNVPFDITPVYTGKMHGNDIAQGAVTAGLVITIGYL